MFQVIFLCFIRCTCMKVVRLVWKREGNFFFICLFISFSFSLMREFLKIFWMSRNLFLWKSIQSIKGIGYVSDKQDKHCRFYFLEIICIRFCRLFQLFFKKKIVFLKSQTYAFCIKFDTTWSKYKLNFSLFRWGMRTFKNKIKSFY